MQWRGVRRLSVCLSVNFCTNRFFSQTNGRIATKLAHDGLQVSVHPRCAQGQGQRSRDTSTFVLSRKPLLLAGKWLDRGQTCTQWSPEEFTSRVCSSSRSRCKVTWYQHIWNFTKNHWPSLSLASPSLFPFGFLLAVSDTVAHIESHGETVCHTDCYTVRSDVLSLRAITLWSIIALSFQYQAARCNV